MNFHDLGLHKALLRTLEEAEHTTPTPIQEQAIPIVIDGHDVVGLAQTGTGKTAAFLLPLIHKQDRPNHKGKFRPIRVLILSPTRELAAQIYEKARLFGKSMNLRSQCTVGGVHINKQIHQLSRGTDILIATPGRLLDLAKRNAIKFDSVDALVLDEADHMLDIGFLPDVKRIIAQLPKERQTLLFSATMPKAIQDLAAQYLNDPVEITVARQSSVAENIDQSVRYVIGRQKPDELAKILQEATDIRTVVFARTKHGADNIVRRLATLNIDARAIHGNKTQGQRERAIKAFTRGAFNVLVATDIAARGIDIKDVGLVVNYELPDVPEVYVHRIGRTARAGATGRAIAFCTESEVNQLRAIERLIKINIPSEGKLPASEKRSKGKPKAKAKSKPNNSRNRPGSKARKKPDYKPRSEIKREASVSDEGDNTRKHKAKGDDVSPRRKASKHRSSERSDKPFKNAKTCQKRQREEAAETTENNRRSEKPRRNRNENKEDRKRKNYTRSDDKGSREDRNDTRKRRDKNSDENQSTPDRSGEKSSSKNRGDDQRRGSTKHKNFDGKRTKSARNSQKKRPFRSKSASKPRRQAENRR